MEKSLYYQLGSVARKVLPVVVLLLTTVFPVSAAVDSAPLLPDMRKEKVTLSLTEASLEEFIKSVEAQTAFRFTFDEKELAGKRLISINARNEPLSTVLERITAKTGLEFKLINNNIHVRLPKNHKSQSGKLPAASAYAQQEPLTGRVTDSKGVGLPGVSIAVKGTSKGTVTDADGTFSLAASPKDVLVFSYIGFATKEVTVGNQNKLEVALSEDAKALEEVVVTALGIKREAKKLGYATATVDPEALLSSRSTNVGNNLVGKVSGVNVQTPPTGPGGSAKIRIRGQSSFGGNNSPLIVVNGVPINNEPQGRGNGADEGFAGEAKSDTGDGLQSINPEDIESMTVLKGAAAAALYGFRAKDGAIIITTKSGKGQTGIGVTLSSTVQADQALDFTDFQYEYGQGENGVRPQSESDARSSGVWSFGERFDGQPTWQVDGKQHPYSPFRDRTGAFYRTGLMVQNTVALAGGNENGNFRVSFSNTDSEGIIPKSGFTRRSLNLGLNYNLTKKLSTLVNVNYTNEYNKNPPVVSQQDFNVNSTLYTLANSIDPRWMKDAYKNAETGNEINPARFTNRTNMYWSINERFENRKRDRLFGNMALRYEFTPWLYAQGRIGQDYFTVNHEVNRPTGTAFLPPPPSGFNGNYYQDTETFRELNMDFLVGANHAFGDFSIDATFGGNSMDQTAQTLSTSVTNFYVRDLYTINNGQIKAPDYSYYKKRVNSLYGTVDFGFREYLFLTLTGRNDWFSTLNPESNSYLYPSVSTSFVFSQAFASSLPTWINFGKLRAAYAEVGGDTDPYTNQLFYGLNNNTLNSVPLGSIAGTVSPNPNLRPLKVKEAEVGLELRLFDSRVNLDLAAYRKNTEDEILNVDISNASGYGQTKVNVGRLRNQGVEMLLGIMPVRNSSITWETAFNLTYNKSEVLELANNQQRIDVGTGEYIGIVSHEVGMPLGSLRGVDFRRDEQGRIVTSQGRMLGGEIVTYGSAVPTHTGGWLNTFNFKGFRLFAQVDFKAGHKLISNSNFNWYRHGLHKATLEGREGGVIFPSVTPEGEPNTTAVIPGTFYNGVRSFSIATPFVYNASFVRWRTVSLGYDLSKLLGDSFIKGLNVNAYVNNVLMIKKYVDNLDPESQYSASDNLAGLEAHSLPTTRSYGVNINIKL
ncbi:TonB-linked SusC/RagA family outer membrane protein [Pontibacter ummariensis]|uniref:TonB-linked outer membrane protein, SusC/RagA family n=1 Tax=Pontibacter ummariensis TaxID=1610492 RepID=A0A239B8R6_9BACT|nr:SusC/RagA family TonB-linked outer membrane protein [Pontibacter ummariensis]PRY16367.1 TonB-linked SusC/RagA family outer membrane protein [Pontibacter ummariensis]SNS03931.1 TonB-linked outer membrane protein, SusC/RagA family [Pontibacter ummariensis]